MGGGWPGYGCIAWGLFGVVRVAEICSGSEETVKKESMLRSSEADGWAGEGAGEWAVGGKGDSEQISKSSSRSSVP